MSVPRGTSGEQPDLGSHERCVTRWWLEGGGGDDALVLIVEHGEPGDLPCVLPPPERPRRRGYVDEGDHADWLSSGGVGVSTTFAEGAHGWIESVTMSRTLNRNAAHAAAARTKSRRKLLHVQEVMSL